MTSVRVALDGAVEYDKTAFRALESLGEYDDAAGVTLSPPVEYEGNCVRTQQEA